MHLGSFVDGVCSAILLPLRGYLGYLGCVVKVPWRNPLGKLLGPESLHPT